MPTTHMGDSRNQWQICQAKIPQFNSSTDLYKWLTSRPKCSTIPHVKTYPKPRTEKCALCNVKRRHVFQSTSSCIEDVFTNLGNTIFSFIAYVNTLTICYDYFSPFKSLAYFTPALCDLRQQRYLNRTKAYASQVDMHQNSVAIIYAAAAMCLPGRCCAVPFCRPGTCPVWSRRFSRSTSSSVVAAAIAACIMKPSV